MTGGELIENRADRVDITARVAAHMMQLFGCNTGRGAFFLAERGIVQIRQLGVVRHAEVDQHHLAAGAVAHVGRFEVEMNDVLVVQRLHRATQAHTKVAHTSSSIGARCAACASASPSMHSMIGAISRRSRSPQARCATRAGAGCAARSRTPQARCRMKGQLRYLENSGAALDGVEPRHATYLQSLPTITTEPRTGPDARHTHSRLPRAAAMVSGLPANARQNGC
jgi:hypothetical protein